MKKKDIARILDIIAEHPIETQDELLTRLREEGFKATQATISRDIKDLRLVKTSGSDGKYRYVSASRSSTDIRTNFQSLSAPPVNSIDVAQNFVVIKTLSGMAQAVCAALVQPTIRLLSEQLQVTIQSSLPARQRPCGVAAEELKSLFVGLIGNAQNFIYKPLRD